MENKDVSTRVCVDFRKLNKITKVDPEPMTTAEVLLRQLSGKKYLTKINLSQGYWLIPVAQGDVHKTAFVTPDGQYSRATLELLPLEDLGRFWREWLELETVKMTLYIVTAVEDHLRMLKQLFSRLRKARITARTTKC